VHDLRLPRRFARFGEDFNSMPLSRILNDQLTPCTTSSNSDPELHSLRKTPVQEVN